MSRAFRFLVSGVAVALMALAISVQAQDPPAAPKPSNKWRIPCSGYAYSAGTVQFRVSRPDSPDLDVTANVAKGDSDSQVAKDIRDAFKAALPKDNFHVETDDGQDVLLKARGGQKDYLVAFVSLTVEGVSVRMKRE
ncbi:MAG TPA: hypothetical protein VE046_03615 [Steroidobacteraceae bacterium]|nr:hypothetical protein [Steroidobacteraceae bacterium]